MEVIQRQKCVYCKMNMTIDNFNKKRDDSYHQKTCNQCLANHAAYAKKHNKTYKCPHGRKKVLVKTVGVSVFVNMVGDEINVQSVVAQVCANTTGDEINVNSAQIH